MNETLQAPLREQSDIKIFILYLMERIGRPLSFVEINDIVVQNGVVRPFDFCLAFPDLLETGHVSVEETDRGEWYSITEIGKEATRNLSNLVLHTTREKALQNAILLLNMRKTETEYRYHIESMPDGRFLFRLFFTEKKVDIISLSVVVDTKKEAENMQVQFEHHPDMFRLALKSLLVNNAASISAYDPFLQL